MWWKLECQAVENGCVALGMYFHGHPGCLINWNTSWPVYLQIRDLGPRSWAIAENVAVGTFWWPPNTSGNLFRDTDTGKMLNGWRHLSDWRSHLECWKCTKPRANTKRQELYQGKSGVSEERAGRGNHHVPDGTVAA